MTGVEFVDKIRSLVLKKMRIRKVLEYVEDDATIEFINQKILDINNEIDNLFKEYMGE